MAPIRPAEDDRGGDQVRLDDALRHRGRDLERDERAHEVENRGEAHGHAGRQRAGRDHRRHHVGRVVEAVGEVERERCGDDDYKDNVAVHAPLLVMRA